MRRQKMAKNCHLGSSALNHCPLRHTAVTTAKIWFRRDRSLQNGLIIPGQIIKAVFNPADTVQDKLTIFSLIQNDVTGNGRMLGSLQTDRVSLVDQEWCHTAAGDIQTDRFAIKNQCLQRADKFRQRLFS